MERLERYLKRHLGILPTKLAPSAARRLPHSVPTLDRRAARFMEDVYVLVLKRQVEQEVVIRSELGDVIVQFLGYRGGQAKLGFTANDSYSIHRREVQLPTNRATAGATASHLAIQNPHWFQQYPYQKFPPSVGLPLRVR